MTEPAANRKHLILDAACRAIARTGAAAVRVSDVAREAGVSTALVHYYFPSRRRSLTPTTSPTRSRRSTSPTSRAGVSGWSGSS